jgi:hypothetical protein
MAKGDVMVWDFAGQLEYITTHQFFLSKEVFQWRHNIKRWEEKK